MIEFLGFFACEIAVLHVFFVWIDRRWPPRLAVDVSHLDAGTRARMAKRANRVGTGLSLLAWPLTMIAWGLGFYDLQLWMLPQIPGAVFVRMPSAAMHMIPALFASIVLAGPIGLLGMRIIYGRRFHEIMAVGDAHFRFDVRRWMYATFVWIVPLCVDAESLWLGRYIVFAPDGIHSRGVWSRRQEFRPYRDVATLVAVDGQKVLHNQFMPDRRFLVLFRDGHSVPSPRFAYHDGRPEDFGPLKYASQQSGVPIRWVPEFD